MFKNGKKQVNLRSDTFKLEVFAIFCFAVAIRSIISLYSYSGNGAPPMYGDYEAQRHWQEVTINVPIKDWYINTTQNDLQYWGLDYPPLTAYHSYALGRVAKYMNESFVKLYESRGIESREHKVFMRHSVLIVDILLYLPALLYLAFCLVKTCNKPQLLFPTLVIFLMFPGQILIDNGHFQYNNVSLGLAALAIAGILNGRHYLAAFLFTLAFNYKQMELYHAVTFFAFLLKKCEWEKGFLKGLMKLILVGTIVIATMGLIWLPWLSSWDSAFGVVKRLFPIGRGIFEDKVANFWCALNVIYKLKAHFTNEKMALIALAATASAIIPVNFLVFKRSTKINFLYGLAATSMAFFLFSYQVHEKSILLVCLPAMCLFPLFPHFMFWFLEVATLSMFPLLQKDGLTVPFIILLLVFHIVMRSFLKNLKRSDRMHDKIFACFENHIVLLGIIAHSIFGPTSESYPFLWPLINALFSCFQFGIFYLKVFFELVFVENIKKKSNKKNK